MALLGVRLRGDSPGWHVMGRETYLARSLPASCWSLADPASWLTLEAVDGEVRALARIGPLRQTLGTRAVPPGPVVLRIEVRLEALARGPDTVYLGVEDPGGRFTALAELDGRYLSTEVAGGFTGRVVGMYCAAGTVRIDWFDYESKFPERAVVLRPTAAGPAR
jgi:hypothetical protein